MPLRPLPYGEVKRKLEAAGFVEAGQSGSHIKFKKTTEQGTRTAIVPHHREVAVGRCEVSSDRRALIPMILKSYRT
jgi:predicted RNA binding protein YcfA (HicA-like mRNA interferase family)